MSDRHIDSLQVGGGYGDTGATIESDGDIKTDASIVVGGNIQVDESSWGPARLTVARTTNATPLLIIDEATSDSTTILKMQISDGNSGANNANGDQYFLFSDDTDNFSAGVNRAAGVNSYNITGASSTGSNITFRSNADDTVDLPEGDITAGTSQSKQGIMALERGAASTKPGTTEYTSSDGTALFVFADNAGRLRSHTSLPVNDTDGNLLAPPPSAFAGLAFNAPAGELTTISAADTPTQISFNNDWGGIEEEDPAAFAVANKAASTITIGTDGGGLYSVNAAFSASSANSAKLFWHSVNVTRTIAITSSDVTGTIRVTTTAAHGLSSGDTVVITGSDNADTNGAFVIKVIASTTFDLYDFDGAAVTSAGANGTGGNVDGFSHRSCRVNRHYSGTTVGAASIMGRIALLDGDVLKFMVLGRTDASNITFETASFNITRVGL